MAKKKKRRSARQVTIPISIVGPIAMTGAWAYDSHPEWYPRIKHFIGAYIPYADPVHPTSSLKVGLLPLIAGLFIHKIVGGYLGVNRMLGQAKIPFIRI